MPTKAKLSAILDALGFQSDETHAYLDREKGEVVVLSDEELGAADDERDPADYPEWQRKNIEQAKAVQADTTGRFVPLPDRFDINEWDMMRDFATSQEDERLAEDLLRAIQGRGAFRYFKDRIHEAGLADAWYKFRDAQFRKVALEWGEAHGVEVDANA